MIKKTRFFTFSRYTILVFGITVGMSNLSFLKYSNAAEAAGPTHEKKS